MRVHEIMSIELVTVSPNTPFRDIWHLIFQKRVHSVPVVDDRGKLLGIIVEQDLLQPLYPNYSEIIDELATAGSFDDLEQKVADLSGLKADEIMCKRVIFTRTNSMAMRALSRMLVHNLRQLPVLDENDNVRGIISKGDIFDGLFKTHISSTKKTRSVARSIKSAPRSKSTKKQAAVKHSSKRKK